MSERWIVIPNWEKLQHYGSRRDPPWFKTYISILHDDAYLGLTGHQRGTLHGLWAVYAAAHRQVRDSTSTISRQLNMRVTRETLDALNHAGLIEFSASKPLAERYQDASPRALARGEERREEREVPIGTSLSSLQQAKKNNTGKDGLLQEARTLALAWNGGSSDEFDNKLDTLEAVYQTKLGYLERDKLWDIAFTKTVQDDELF